VPRNLAKAGQLYREAAREGEPAGRMRLATLGKIPAEPKARTAVAAKSPKVIKVAKAPAPPTP